MKKKGLFYKIFISLIYFSIPLFIYLCLVSITFCNDGQFIPIYSSGLSSDYSLLGTQESPSFGGLSSPFSLGASYSQATLSIMDPNSARRTRVTCSNTTSCFCVINSSGSLPGEGNYSLPTLYGGGYGIYSGISNIYGGISGIYTGLSNIYGGISSIYSGLSNIYGGISGMSGGISGMSGGISNLYGSGSAFPPYTYLTCITNRTCYPDINVVRPTRVTCITKCFCSSLESYGIPASSPPAL